MKITEIDYSTTPETIIERDATPAELAQLKADKAADIEHQKNVDAKELAKLALLKRLGMTTDEVALLLQ